MKKEAGALTVGLEGEWQKGCDEFNAGRHWEAHERWEQGWKDLPEIERAWVQGWIQLAGAIHLHRIGRPDPARALCRRALELLDQGEGRGQGDGEAERLPRLWVEGGREFLRAEDFGERAVAALRARVVRHA